MKLSKASLIRIIKEELNKLLSEEGMNDSMNMAHSLADAFLAAYRNRQQPRDTPSISQWLMGGEVEGALVTWSQENNIPDDLFHSPDFEAIIERAKGLVVNIEGESNSVSYNS